MKVLQRHQMLVILQKKKKTEEDEPEENPPPIPPRPQRPSEVNPIINKDREGDNRGKIYYHTGVTIESAATFTEGQVDEKLAKIEKEVKEERKKKRKKMMRKMMRKMRMKMMMRKKMMTKILMEKMKMIIL